MNSRIGQRDILPARIVTRLLQDGCVTNAKIANLTWDKAQGGTATLGGLDNGDGILTIKDATNVVRITVDKDGLTFNDGTNDVIFLGIATT
jgi:hypothetical protein